MEYGRSDILQKLLIPVVENFSLNRDQLFSLSSVLTERTEVKCQKFVSPDSWHSPKIFLSIAGN